MGHGASKAKSDASQAQAQMRAFMQVRMLCIANSQEHLYPLYCSHTSSNICSCRDAHEKCTEIIRNHPCAIHASRCLDMSCLVQPPGPPAPAAPHAPHAPHAPPRAWGAVGMPNLWKARAANLCHFGVTVDHQSADCSQLLVFAEVTR